MTRIRVTALCTTEDNHILLLEESVNGRTHSLPGGGVKEGETLAAALQRELSEELGSAIPISNQKIAYISEYDRADNVHVLEIAMWIELDRVFQKPEKCLLVPLGALNDYLQPKTVAAIQNAHIDQARYIGTRDA